MDGYYKDQQQTAETIKNGWLHTGDEGAIDDEGFLRITGRVKDIFKTSKGKYVAPSPIEMKLSANKNLEQICVVGDGILSLLHWLCFPKEERQNPTTI